MGSNINLKMVKMIFYSKKKSQNYLNSLNTEIKNMFTFSILSLYTISQFLNFPFECFNEEILVKKVVVWSLAHTLEFLDFSFF